MVDSKLGSKRVCEACGAKFYDLNKNPATCPKCGHSFDPMASATAAQPVREVAPTAEAPVDDNDGELEDEDDDTLSLDDIAEGDDVEESEDEALAAFEDGDALLDADDDDDDDDDSFLKEDDEDDV